jgi:Tol biopolymer transport system component
MTDRGRNTRRITEGERPAWAPRGASIAFLRDTNLFVADAGTGAVRLLVDLRCEDDGGTSLSSPEWSPDGKQIVVPVGCDWGRFGYVSALLVDAGGDVTGSLPINLALSRVAWSPDGARVAYSFGEPWSGDSPRIETTLLDGTAMTTVSSGSGDDRDPDW